MSLRHPKTCKYSFFNLYSKIHKAMISMVKNSRGSSELLKMEPFDFISQRTLQQNFGYPEHPTTPTPPFWRNYAILIIPPHGVITTTIPLKFPQTSPWSKIISTISKPIRPQLGQVII